MSAFTTWISRSIMRAGWAPLAFFLLHVTLSKGFGAYLAKPGLDVPMHFFGGVVIAFFLRTSARNEEGRQVLGPMTTLAENLLVFASVCTATVIWEFAEWSGDSLGLTDAKVGLDDTILDMFLGVLGGVVYLLAVGLWKR